MKILNIYEYYTYELSKKLPIFGSQAIVYSMNQCSVMLYYIILSIPSKTNNISKYNDEKKVVYLAKNIKYVKNIESKNMDTKRRTDEK